MEDKALLEAIAQMMDDRDKRLFDMMDAKLEPINARLSSIDQRTTKIEVTLENDIKKDLELLHEGQAGMNEKFAKLDKVADDVEDIKIKVSAIESVTKDNTSQIKQLRKVN